MIINTPPQSSGQTHIPDDWVRRFKTNIAGHPTGLEAWREIHDAGIEETAYLDLWGYSDGAGPEIHQMHRSAEKIADLLKSAIRAKNIAEKKSPKHAGNPHLFRERASDHRKEALEAEWPMASSDTVTVQDELKLARKIKGRPISLEAARPAIVRAAGKRSPTSSPLYFLFRLQEHARLNGIELGLKRLTALANCANDGRELDEGTLGRYLRSISQSVRNGIREDISHT